jgi:hypothetical protein
MPVIPCQLFVIVAADEPQLAVSHLLVALSHTPKELGENDNDEIAGCTSKSTFIPTNTAGVPLVNKLGRARVKYFLTPREP